MDAILVISLALILYLYYLPSASKPPERTPRVKKVIPNPMLNPEMKHDENAFMRIANELDFY